MRTYDMKSALTTCHAFFLFDRCQRYILFCGLNTRVNTALLVYTPDVKISLFRVGDMTYGRISIQVCFKWDASARPFNQKHANSFTFGAIFHFSVLFAFVKV